MYKFQIGKNGYMYQINMLKKLKENSILYDIWD
jgi:hypothetical protein